MQIEIDCAGTDAHATFVEVGGGPTNLSQLRDTCGLEAGMAPFADGLR